MTTSALDNIGPHLLGRKPSEPDPRNFRLADYLDPDEVAAAEQGRWHELLTPVGHAGTDTTPGGLGEAHADLATLLGVVEPAGDTGSEWAVPLAAAPTPDDLRRALDAMREHDRDPFAAWARGPFLRWAQIVSAVLLTDAPPDPAPPGPAPDPAPTPAPASAVIWPNTEVLDQGQTPHCCGFGGCTAMNTLGTEGVDDHYGNADGDRLYSACKDIDGAPGAEDGSSVHSVARALMQWGRIGAYAWAGSLAEQKAWVLGHGPLIVGTDWYEGMFTPDPDGRVHLTGQVVGGHCWTVRGYDPATDTFLGQNSWGTGWAIAGCFLIAGPDLERLTLADGGEALAALELAAA